MQLDTTCSSDEVISVYKHTLEMHPNSWSILMNFGNYLRMIGTEL
jgi:hypothetical protein